MPPSKVPEHIREADRVWSPRRFRTASWLWFKTNQLPIRTKLRHSGEPVFIFTWRFAWFGISLSLWFDDGRVEHGYDPATVEIP